MNGGIFDFRGSRQTDAQVHPLGSLLAENAFFKRRQSMSDIKLRILKEHIQAGRTAYHPPYRDTHIPTREEFHREYTGSIRLSDFSTERPAAYTIDKIAGAHRRFRKQTR